jgi:hypothetical protein
MSGIVEREVDMQRNFKSNVLFRYLVSDIFSLYLNAWH